MKFNSFFTQVEPTCNRTKSIISCMILVLFIIISCQEPSTQQEEATRDVMADGGSGLRKELGGRG